MGVAVTALVQEMQRPVDERRTQLIEEAKGDIAAAFQVLEKHLVHNTYIVGHHLTLADICAQAALRHVKKAADGLITPDKYQSLTRWYSTVEAQTGKAVQATSR